MRLRGKIASVVLSAFLLFGGVGTAAIANEPVLRIGVQFSDEYMSRDAVRKAVDLAIKHYGGALGRLGISYKEIIPVTIWFYRPKIFRGVYFPPPGVSIMINVDSFDDIEDIKKREAQLIYTVAHELGHHLLMQAGVSVENQHPLMYCTVDMALAEEIGAEFNIFVAMFYCMG